MTRGDPLTDKDRQGWLEALRDHETAAPPQDSSPHLVMTCSALKRHYRDVLREGAQNAGNLRIRFVFLDAPEEVLTKRAAERKGHFAGPQLVRSQFEALERPDGKDARWDLNVDGDSEEEEGRDQRVEGVLRAGREKRDGVEEPDVVVIDVDRPLEDVERDVKLQVEREMMTDDGRYLVLN